jgi:hypothetical protein
MERPDTEGTNTQQMELARRCRQVSKKKRRWQPRFDWPNDGFP